MYLFFQISAVVLACFMFLITIRVVLGPRAVDRLVGVNMIGTKSVVLLVILGILFGRLDMFIDIAIGYGLLNFITSVAVAKFFQHQRKLDLEMKERQS